MKILFVVSEVEDLVKTGGLADVAKALPIALKKMGHEVIVIMPFYRVLAEKFDAPAILPEQALHAYHKAYPFIVREMSVGDVPVYGIDHTKFFDREGIYSDGYHAYFDNGERFAFFADAALHTAKLLDFQPDIVHCNDWHTALTPYFMRSDNSGFFANSKSILTIHNGAYQGTSRLDGIPYLHPHFELHHQLDGDAVNFLRIGIRYANKISTVSPNYANELLSPLGSHHLYEEFQGRKHDVVGILNGCDYSSWDPATDEHLPKNFDVNDRSGKDVCKTTLQKEVGLTEDTKVPLIGMVCRLTDQKGFNYILPMLEDLMKHNMQLVIVGTGDPAISAILKEVAAEYPGKFAFLEAFSVPLSHLLEAGSDFFLMPSMFEPCGLNQMYSLAYGTLPIVRAVGGLTDTVVDLDDELESSTGFVFVEPSGAALLRCIQRALLHYHEYPEGHIAMQNRAMHTRFTWEASAKDYESLYHSCS